MAEFAVDLARTDADRRDVGRFRYEIYVEEMGKPYREVDHERRLLQDELDAASAIVTVREAGRLVATIRHTSLDHEAARRRFAAPLELPAFEEIGLERVALASRLMVAADYRGSRAMLTTLRAFADLCRRQGTDVVLCACRPSLVALYGRLGFRQYSHGYSDAEAGFQVPMVLSFYDRPAFVRARSPFLDRLHASTDCPGVGDYVRWLAGRFPIAAESAPPDGVEEPAWLTLARSLHGERAGSVPPFLGLEPEEARDFLAPGATLRCRAGDRLIRRGEHGLEMFIVTRGEFEARIGGSVVSVMRPGEVFGEVGLLSRYPRLADVVATGPAEVLVVSRRQLDEAMRRAPALATKVLYNLSLLLCERLGRSSGRLSAEAAAQ